MFKQTQNPFKKYFPHTDQRLIGVEPRVWPHLHGPQEDHAQLGVGWAEGGSDAGGRPDMASQLYGLRSGVLRYGQLSPRTRAQSVWA